MYSVSLLDCTLKNVTFLSDTRVFENVSLHGLVISSGEIKRVHRSMFLGLKKPLQALGNNLFFKKYEDILDTRLYRLQVYLITPYCRYRGML